MNFFESVHEVRLLGGIDIKTQCVIQNFILYILVYAQVGTSMLACGQFLMHKAKRV